MTYRKQLKHCAQVLERIEHHRHVQIKIKIPKYPDDNLDQRGKKQQRNNKKKKRLWVKGKGGPTGWLFPHWRPNPKLLGL